MKQVSNLKSFFNSNPSYLGADRLWADGIDELSRNETEVGDYDGI